MARALPLLLAVSLHACATPSPIMTGGPTAGLGQAAVVGNLRVTPTHLVEDSRCPADVQCVWAGRVRVRVEVDAGAGAEAAELGLGEPRQVGGHSLELISVDPQKRSGEVVPPRAYRFTFAAMRQN